MSNETESCGCTGDTERAGHDPAYRRVLWIVVILNIGFGLIEIVAGFLSGSQWEIIRDAGGELREERTA